MRALLREEGVTFQRLKTWKASKDRDYAEKKARIEYLYAIADREVIPGPGGPEVIFCVGEFGPLNLPAASGPAVGGGQRRIMTAGAGAGRTPQCRVPAAAETSMLTLSYHKGCRPFPRTAAHHPVGC